MRTLGIILIIAGILMLVFRGFNFTEEKEVADVGPIELNTKEKRTVSWPLYAGGIVTVVGVVLVLADRRKAS